MGRIALALGEAEPPAGLEQRIMARLALAAPGDTAPAGRRRTFAFLRSPAWGIAAVVLVLLLAAGNVTQWARGAPSARTAASPGLDTIILVGVNDAKGAYGTVVLDAKDNGGVLAVRDMPRLDAGHQYQLWLVRGDERRSGGVFSVDDDGYGNLLLSIPRDFKGFTGIGISVEPKGGSPAPTGARVAAGKL